MEQDENVIDRIAAAQREELDREIAGLQAEAARVPLSPCETRLTVFFRKVKVVP